MINFENYKIVKLPKQREKDTIPFVGIYPNENGKPFFILPQGFEEFEDEKVSDFFMDLYKTFKNYQNSLENRLKINRDENIKKLNDGKYEITNKDGEITIFYSKLDLIDNIIELVEGHSFIDFNTKIVPTKPFEIKSRHLESALYQNNIAVIDEILDNKRFLTTKPSIDILNMLVFIYSQINEKLGEKDKNRKYKNFYDSFIEKFKLNSNDKIFNKNSKSTINKLREILEVIDKKTYYKDNLYFDIYEAIENFLYFNKMRNSKKLKWGIDNFSFIWEDICQNYVFDKYKDDILFADSYKFSNVDIPYRKKDGIEGVNKYYIKSEKLEDYPFFLEKINHKKIFLYPDLIIKNIIFNNDYSIKFTIDNWNSFGTHNNIVNIIISDKYAKIVKYDTIPSIEDDNPKTLNEEEKKIYFLESTWKGEYESSFLNKEHFKFYHKQKTNYIFQFIKSIRNSTIKFDFSSTEELKEFKQKVKKEFGDNALKYVLFMLDIDFNYYSIIDFKYVSKNFLEKEDNQKVKNDSIKQLVYELALKQHKDFEDSLIQNYFWIPKYFKDNEYLEKEIEIENKMLNDREIKVIEINFIKLQKNYIGEK